MPTLDKSFFKSQSEFVKISMKAWETVDLVPSVEGHNFMKRNSTTRPNEDSSTDVEPVLKVIIPTLHTQQRTSEESSN